MNRAAEGAAGPTSGRGRGRILALLALAMLVKGLLWSYAVPPFDAPDEPAHYSHAQALALTGHFPAYGTLDRTSPDVDVLTFATLLEVPPGAPAARLYQERATTGGGPVGPRELAASRAPRRPANRVPSGFYGPVSYVLYAIPIGLLADHGIVAQLAGARLVAVLFGVVAVLAVAWAGYEAGLNTRMSVAAALITGYQPMWSQQTAVVNADAALLCWASVFFALLLRWLRRPSPAVGTAAATALALTLLSKPAGLFALPLSALFLVPAVRSRGPQRWRALGLGMALLALAILPFLAWNVIRPAGTPTVPDRGTISTYWAMFASGGFAYFRGVLAGFWGNFGWLEQTLAPALLTGLRYVFVAAFLLCGVAVARRRPGARAVALGTAYFLMCGAVAFGYDLLLWLNLHTTGVQGRYLLPALGALVVAVVVAINSLLPRRWAHGVVATVACGMLALNMVSLGVLAGRYFVS